MNPAMPDAVPLTPHFLASLSQFLEKQHGGQGQGDISQGIKAAIEQLTPQDAEPMTEASESPSQACAAQPNVET